MRSSSIKSIVAVFLISATVLAATPAAAARQTQKSQSTRTREVAPSTDRFAGVRELINRTLRRLGLNGGISLPTPKQDEEAMPTLPNGPSDPNDPA